MDWPLLVLLAAVLPLARAEGLYKDGSPVTSLVKPSELPSGVGADQPFTLLEFYSAWCGHCQHFAPIYEEVARDARRQLPDLKVTAVNCADHDDICNDRHVNSYPTLMLYPGEKKFDGAHTKQAVLDWVLHEHGPSTASRGGGGDSGDGSAGAGGSSSSAVKASGGGDGVGDTAAKEAKPHELLRQHIESLKANLSQPLKGLAKVVAHAATKGAASASQHPKGSGLQAALAHHPAADAAMLQLRPMPRPIPTDDVLAAARYTLQHDVLAALSAAPSQAYQRTKLGALRAWLHLLQRGLPQGRDGGVAAAGAAELLSGLHGRTSIPEPDAWREMLRHAGVDAWPTEWHACNSSHAELHAYPCSLWLLFHSLLAHASEPEGLPSLHAVAGYVNHFFGCKECVGHFAVLAAGMESTLREMATEHRHGRDRAALWLWQAHNQVNERLAAEALTDSPAAEFAEFAKVQWPSRSGCQDCREVTRPQAGVKAQVHWRHEAVLAVLYEAYCLEPRFECWQQLTRMGQSRPPTEDSATLGTGGMIAGIALLLLVACGALRCSFLYADNKLGGGPKKKKRDHVV